MTPRPLACLWVPALPLQLLLQRQAAPAGAPVAVIDAPTRAVPQIVCANATATRQGVRRGMRLSEAVSLCPTLQADTVPEAEVVSGVERLWHALLAYTPGVEPDATQPGLFWLDPNGLQHLYASISTWANSVAQALAGVGWRCGLTVGFNRYRAYALCCTRQCVLQGYIVADSPAQERTLSDPVPLVNLGWPATVLQALQLLDITTLGAFLRLSRSDVRQRFGPEAEAVHRAAQPEATVPLQGQQPSEPLGAEQLIEPADADVERLLFAIKSLLQPLFASLRRRCESLAILHVRLQITARVAHHERLQPGAPTLDERTWLELIRLRLAAAHLAGPVEAIQLTAEGVRLTPGQLDLLTHRVSRDLHAATAAVAKVRAALGDATVTRARLVDAHLPELRFVYEPIDGVCLPEPPPVAPLVPLVRQVWPTPKPLPPRPRHEPELWLSHEHGAVETMQGPYRLQAHWWHPQGIDRDYYYIQTARQSILWVYYDAPKRCWHLQGCVD